MTETNNHPDTELNALHLLMATEPDFVEDLLDRILENQIAVAKNALSMGADIIIDTDDLAFNSGPFMSPAMFDIMIAPRLRKFAGAFVLRENDGYIK